MHRYLVRRFLTCLWLSVLAGTLPAHAQTPAQRIRGDVVSLDGSTLRVRTTQGETVALEVADNVRLTAVSRAERSAIAPGVFLGTTAVPQADGTLAAVEVHIFAESMRGTGEGHRPMDSPGNTMTNATVTGVSGSGGKTMTNATVAEGATGQRIILQYKGGEKTVTLGADVPIVFLEPADRSMLASGAHVVLTATAQENGRLRADRITVGKDGTVPPM
ncbi:hypothetical protein [Propionivibrio sp.]|uniref:hypothetical protein n=1 Tax=Propionivibrio sp. TaxID=2212460 RepID=UPI0039E2EC21